LEVWGVGGWGGGRGWGGFLYTFKEPPLGGGGGGGGGGRAR